MSQVRIGGAFANPTESLSLTDLSDVSLSSLVNDDILAYDSATGLWINQTLSQIGAAANTGNFIMTANSASYPNARALIGTANRITVTDNGAGSSIVLSTPQNIHTAATPTFASMTLSGLSSGGVLFAGVGGVISNDPNYFFYTSATHRLGIGAPSGGNAQLYVDASLFSPVGLFLDNAQDSTQTVYGAIVRVSNENGTGSYDEVGFKANVESGGFPNNSIGVWGVSNPSDFNGESIGVKGEGLNYGVLGLTTGAIGVYGVDTSGYGMFGQVTTGIGVQGTATGSGGTGGSFVGSSATGKALYAAQLNASGHALYVDGGKSYIQNTLSIGTTTVSAKLSVLATTEQLRLSYDASNYASFTVTSGGDLTIAPTGSDTSITGTLAISSTVTGGTYNGQTISSAASFTGTLAVASTVTGGTYNGQTISSTASFTGTLNVATGYKIAGAATSGNYLRGDGTNFVSSAIQTADIPAGSGNYIQNTTIQQSSSNFNISANGVIGGTLSVTGISTLTGAVTMTGGFDSNTASTVTGLTVDGSGNLSVSDGLTTLTSTSATASVKALTVTQSGAVSGTGYAGHFTKSGASTANVGIYATASGGTANYAAIFDAGFVGMGITTPLEKLHMSATGAKLVVDAAAYTTSKFNSQGIAWASTTTNAIIFNDAAGNRPEISWLRGARTYPEFSIRQHTTADRGGSIWSGTGLVAPTETMSFYNGSVGINVSAPVWKLDISDSGGIGLRVTSSVDTQAAVLRLVTGNTAGSGTSAADLQFYDGATQSFRFLAALGNSPASARYGGFIAYQDRDGTYLPLRFFTTDAGGTQQGAMYIAAGQTAGTTGNVGIGTITPVSNLDVTSATGGIFTLSRNDTSVTAADVIGKIQFWGNDTQLTTQNIFASIEVQSLSTITTDSAAGEMIFKTTSTTAGSSPTEQMRIDSEGLVGIGTNNPNSLLHIQKDADALTILRVKNVASLANTAAAAEVIMETVDASGFFGAFHSAYAGVARYQDKFVMGANSDASGLVFNAAVSTQTAQFYIGSSALPLMHMELSEVGINTITPLSALHVVKNTAGTMPTGIGGNVSAIFQNNDATTRNNELVFVGGSVSGGVILNFTSDAGAYSAQGRIFYGTGNDIMTIWTAGAEKVRISATGYVGIGTTGATSKLDVVAAESDPASIGAIYGTFTSTLTANSANVATGATGDGRINQGAFNATATAGVRGVTGIARVTGASGTVTGAAGVLSAVTNTGAGVLTNMYNFFASAGTNSGGGTVTNFYSFYATANTIGTNIYGFHGNIAAATNRWNLYMLGTADNYLAGDLGLGTTTPTAVLEIKAGTATANTAPLKFNSGTKLTTAEAGVHEYNGNHLLSNATLRFPVGGVLFDSIADITVGGAEADLYSVTLAANTFNGNGDKVTATYGGVFVTVGTEATQLKVKFAGTTIYDSTAPVVATGTSSWVVNVTLIRVSASVIRYAIALNTTGASGFVYAASGELTGLTLSNTNILKMTGTSSGVGSGSGDIVGKMGFVEFKPAA